MYRSPVSSSPACSLFGHRALEAANGRSGIPIQCTAGRRHARLSTASARRGRAEPQTIFEFIPPQSPHPPQSIFGAFRQPPGPVRTQLVDGGPQLASLVFIIRENFAKGSAGGPPSACEHLLRLVVRSHGPACGGPRHSPSLRFLLCPSLYNNRCTLYGFHSARDDATGPRRAGRGGDLPARRQLSWKLYGGPRGCRHRRADGGRTAGRSCAADIASDRWGWE